jgi:Peptidase A4 family
MIVSADRTAASAGVQIFGLALVSLALMFAFASGSEAAASVSPIRHATRASSGVAPITPSSNWSGYAVTSPNNTPISYTSITGTWTVPTATCTPADAGASSAVWVGIGGYSLTSQALEQTGTDTDCDSSGNPTYFAWYELVPADPVNLKVKVMPGDTITTSVNILPSASGGASTVEVQVLNRTRGWRFTKKVVPSALDTSSAEWIEEAPSNCSPSCRPVPLANFGSVSIAKLAAIGDGVGGTLTNPAWTVYPISLVPTSRHVHFALVGSSGSTAGASPGAISADGRSFVVSWLADAADGV